MIFAPGLSTADEVTEISGRGVGLDVVKSVAREPEGHGELESEPGSGTTFRLLVPLTLASIQALLFRVPGASTQFRSLPSPKSRASPRKTFIAWMTTRSSNCANRC